MTELGSYVYGVARGLDPATVAGLSGVAGSPVRVVAHGALSALVSTVDLTEFDESGLRRNLEDLGWLEATARKHHAVLTAAALDTAVVPLRLATIYRSTDRVRALLAERGATFDAALRRVQGRTEWGLKAYLDPGEHSAPTVDQADAGPPGTAYLRRRRAQLRGSEELRRAAEHGAEVIHRAVSAAAEAARRYPSQGGGLSGESREMVLNAAYLLSGTERAPLEEALSQTGNWPLHVEWTGPWVPYSFVELEPDP
ncbi:MAG: GvpL/GvpF family gas vesicle protein [Pseudonocardiales bacterium]